MSEKQKLWSKSTVWRKIGELKLSNETKQKLRDLWYRARRLGQKIVEWLYQKRHFATSVLVGVVAAYLLGYTPIVGSLLADLAVSLGVIVGLLRQFKAEMDRAFGELVAV